MKYIPTNSGNAEILDVPDNCPFCHKSITPNLLYGYKQETELEVFMYCPDSNCNASFIGYYIKDMYNVYFYINKTTKGTIKYREFSEKICEISQIFEVIYNQSFAAEQQNLTEICGVGYRKALEFLIKDYTILNNLDKKDLIEKKALGVVIDEFVNDSRVKSVSKRAVWLGNDHTHYIKKWEGKNLDDLKKLIDLVVHWIEMESLTQSFENEMP